MRRSGRQRSPALWLACFLLCGATCGTKPGGPEDEANLLSGRWQFDALDSSLFQPKQMLVAQTAQDIRVLMDGTLFGTPFERFATGPAAPEALVFQITFTRIEGAAQYEVLTLALDGQLRSLNQVSGVYEVRGNLASGGELRVESGSFSAVRVPDQP
jgi:hypothetical protein